MDKKNIIFGVGVGLLLSGLLFYIGYTFMTVKVEGENIQTEPEIVNNNIIDNAYEMNMVFFYGFDEHIKNIDNSNLVFLKIEKDSPAIEISDQLEKLGLISNKIEFSKLLLQANLEHNLKYGDFIIPKNIDENELANFLIIDSSNKKDN